MITSIVEIAIEFIAVVCGVGGVACFVYLVALLWQDHREWRLFLEDHVREQAARRAEPASEAPQLTLPRTTVTVGTQARTLPEQP